jgi:hypothetical protein
MLTTLQSSAELAHPIANRAMTELESFGHIDCFVVIDEHGAQDFVATLFDPVGMQKELLADVSIHREPPCESVIPYSTENTTSMKVSKHDFQRRLADNPMKTRRNDAHMPESGLLKPCFERAKRRKVQ